MNKNEIFAIGLMSGTSLDGVDLVYVKFEQKNYHNFKILQAETIPYPIKWKQLLQKALCFSDQKLKELDLTYGAYLGDLIVDFINAYKINTIDFIASHGHTILHQPENGITLQIGSGEIIAKKTNHKIVCDFRTQDVQLGGQGAPLVPIGDALMFTDYEFCLNLGGFSNISFKQGAHRIAFDICPVNIVLNYYTQKIGVAFDDSGKMAASGKVNLLLLEKLNDLAFYKKQPPKSLGLEWVKENVFPLIDVYEKEIPNILATYVEHIAIQIGRVIQGAESLLITGGGAFNLFLIKRIAHFANIKIKQQSNDLINFKEALIFAFLGLLRFNNQVNCLKSVTGACKDHSSGRIFTP